MLIVYGTTSLPLPVFLSGMFVGSLKPYLLDSCECDVHSLGRSVDRLPRFSFRVCDTTQGENRR